MGEAGIAALARQLHGSLHPKWLLAALLVWPFRIAFASDGADANRHPELAAVGEFLAARAEPGDVVFVTDWATTSPLASRCRYWNRRSIRARSIGPRRPRTSHAATTRKTAKATAHLDKTRDKLRIPYRELKA